MDERQELLALRRLAELEAKAKDSATVSNATAKAEAERMRKQMVEQMPWYEKARAGFGKAIYDVGRGAGQLVGAVSRDDVAQSRAMDAALMDSGAGMAGNLVGNVAMLAPTAMIPGANTIVGGAAIGAVAGLLQPSASGTETAMNVGFGGVLGGAVPFASRAIQAGRAMAEPLSDVGQQRIVGRALNRAAGADAPAVAQRLREAGAPFVGPSQGPFQRTTMGELIPGSVPTVGQAARNPGVAALERSAAATNPDVTNAISGVMQQQNAARVGLLNDMAGADGARAFAVANRDATAEQLYGAARRVGIDPARLTPDVLQNIAEFSARVPDEVLNRARQLATINGTPMTDATSVQGLHYVKMAIDDLIGAANRSGNRTLERAYVGLQRDLLTGLDNLSPDYAAARNVYAQMSRPINQMDTAQAIADRSINRLTGNLQPNAYANALTDQTAARATGMPNATLAGTMENAQTNALNSLLLDVQRANAANNVGRGAGSDTVQKLAYTNLLEQSGVPTFLQEFAPAQVAGNLLARGADAVYGRANRELSARLAETMLDPAQAARLMEMATPAQRNALMQLIQRGATGLAIAGPATANAQKQ